MTEQELIEKIATLFKNAREEGAIQKWADGISDADEVLALVKEAGYVKLSRNQFWDTTLSGRTISLSDCGRCFQHQFQQGLRKVILEEKDAAS